MAKGPIRRTHLIGQSGVGGLTVLPGGTSVITGVLDDWFTEAGDVDECRINDWRLEKRLNVNHFRLAPDYRRPQRDVPNVGLDLPGHRFPKWHTCPYCHLLTERSNPFEQNRLKCSSCEAQKGRPPFLDQVLIVACCENGHIQDFPWREWVHSSVAPNCSGKLRLISKTGIGLTAFDVTCDECSAKRSLDNVLIPGALTLELDSSALGGYSCRGFRPWHGPNAQAESCGMNLTGMIRNASNIYFPSIYSSLHLPLADTRPIERVLELLSSPPLCDLLNEAPGLSAATLRRNSPSLAAFSVDEIREALDKLHQVEVREAKNASNSDSTEKTELHYREEEHLELSRQQDSEYLVVQHQDMDEYGSDIKGLFKSVALVPTLRETRVQAGFSRIVDGGPSAASQKMLWRSFPPNSHQRWLPANRVYGEGLFFQLEESAVAEWERLESVRERVVRLGRDLLMPVHSLEMNVGVATALLPRLLLVHSFAHALMREFVVTCGYSAPSLRERLYVSKSKTRPMASLLIYTASGDSSGSLGGLVRLGEPETLESLIRRAMQRALWCATDPVCFEAIPETTTSTRELANLAACHNCMFVPETSCEEFNGLLDRAMLVGMYDEPSLGFFSELTN